jgi:hypothetical protein
LRSEKRRLRLSKGGSDEYEILKEKFKKDYKIKIQLKMAKLGRAK